MSINNGHHPFDLKPDLLTFRQHLPYYWHEQVAGAIFRQPLHELQTTYQWVWRGSNPLSSKHIRQLIGLFPQTAIDQSSLSTISFGPAKYHYRSSTPDRQTFTNNVDEAISQFAFTPSCCEGPEIQMHDIPVDDQLVTVQLATVVSAQAFVREFAGTIVEPVLDNTECRLMLPDECEINGICFLDDLIENIREVGPISRYSSSFWKDGKPIRDSGIRTEIGETITALLLGVIACDDPKRCLDPLGDRPEVAKMVNAFLYACQLPAN